MVNTLTEYLMSEKLHLMLILPILRLLSFWSSPLRGFGVYTFGILQIQIQSVTMLLKCIVSSDVKERNLEKDLEELVIEKVTIFNLSATS